jgi:hypothetical protein
VIPTFEGISQGVGPEKAPVNLSKYLSLPPIIPLFYT